MTTQPRPFWSRIAPALTLAVLAPLVAEVLPGATRLSALFVFPIEMCVWGGGAVLIRAAARRWRLGWPGMLLLALALAAAEECLIQQTSLAPMILELKGRVYARAFGVNYVYLLWALAYEAVFVVLVPVELVELIFPSRRERTWLSPAGLAVAAVLFGLGGFLAWFSWTQHARTMVFHVPVYNPPVPALAAAGAVVAALVLAAFALRRTPASAARPAKAPGPWAVGLLAGAWAVLWYGFVLLGFGIAPDFPPAVAVAAELALAAAMLGLAPRFARDPRWRPGLVYAAVCGLMVGAMASGFVGFIRAASADFWFKAATNVVALVLLIVLGARRLGRTASESARSGNALSGNA